MGKSTLLKDVVVQQV